MKKLDKWTHWYLPMLHSHGQLLNLVIRTSPASHISLRTPELTSTAFVASARAFLRVSSTVQHMHILVLLTYINFDKDCANQHSETMTNVSKRVKKGGFHCHVRLVMVMASKMGMTIQQENNSASE